MIILNPWAFAQSRSPTAINVHPFRMKPFGHGLRRAVQNLEEAQSRSP